MKNLLLLLTILSSPTFAGEMFISENYSIKIDLSNEAATIEDTHLSDSTFSTAQAEGWRTEDTYREVVFQILNFIDWGQTRYIAEHPEQFYERTSRQYIGEHPTTGKVDAYMAQTAVLHFAIAHYAPPEWRAAFQYITIGDKLNATIGNAVIGIKFSASFN
jgi:hypothetical protein